MLNEKDKIADEMYEMVEKLEDYAVEIRYPDDWYYPTVMEAKEAYEIAKKVKEFVLNKVNCGDSNKSTLKNALSQLSGFY